MWIHNLDPVILRLGFLEIRHYGLVYIFGFLISLGWMFYLKKRGRVKLDKEEIWDLSFWLMLGLLIGSRVFEVFWEPGIYLTRPWELLMVWKGGMSFHGGLAGIIIAAWLFCKKKRISFYKIADLLSVPTIFALALGRIANFINGELVGRITSVDWCVVFPGYDQACRHPSTLYSAGKRFLVFGWLLFLSFKQEFKAGFIFWNFIFWVGLGRIIIDFYREDILYLGFSLGQWFSLVMVIAALAMFIRCYQKDWKNLLKIR